MKNRREFSKKLFLLAVMLLQFVVVSNIARLDVLVVIGISIITLLSVGIGNQVGIFYLMWLMFGVFLTIRFNEQDSGAEWI